MKLMVINKWQLIVGVIVIILMLALVLNPSVYMQATLGGILLWANNVLPALFPFFFLTKILTQLQVLDKLSNLLQKPMQKLFHCPGVSAFVYVMSIVSGYPVGAKLSSELYQGGSITKDELIRINSFTSTSGPLFVIGSVGVGMFVSQTAGVIMLVAHLLGALCNGLLYRNYGYQQIKTLSNKPKIQQKSIDNILGDSVYNSIISILMVGAYIAICSIVIEVLFNFHIIDILIIPLEFIFNLIGLSPDLITGILTGLVEITRGCMDLSTCTASNLATITIIGCGIISFGGLSINLQAITFLSKCNISIPFYFLQKFTQSIFSTIICAILVFLFL